MNVRDGLIAVTLAAFVAGIAGCSGGDKPSGQPPVITEEVQKQDAARQREMNDRLRQNK
jgi:hypothetical protein